MNARVAAPSSAHRAVANRRRSTTRRGRTATPTATTKTTMSRPKDDDNDDDDETSRRLVVAETTPTSIAPTTSIVDERKTSDGGNLIDVTKAIVVAVATTSGGDAPTVLPDRLPIVCGDRHAVLHRRKLGQGSRGPCIEYNGDWLTPNQFQAIAGRTTSKDWKRSIRYNGTSIKRYIKLGLIDVHPHQCACDTCAKQQPTGGPKRKSWRRPSSAKGGGRAGSNGSGTDWSTAAAPTMTDNEIVVVTAATGLKAIAATADSAGGGATTTTTTTTTVSTSRNSDERCVLDVQEEDVRPGISVWSNGVTGLRGDVDDERGEGVADGDGENQNGGVDPLPGNESQDHDDGGSSSSSGRKRPYTVYSDGSPMEQERSSHLFSFAPDSDGKRIKRTDFWLRLGPFLNKSALDSSTSSNNQTNESPLAQTVRSLEEPNPLLMSEWRDLRQVMLRANVPLSPSTWTIEHVAAFIARAGFASCCPVFRENFIDGPALMLLREHHLLDSMQIKVGPAVKLFAIIHRLQAL
ncbi:uncharacterized protein [Oscarella lobularis]|uniref:uncharacterized protein isoform X3 n=1 Tax=Oscarella lobularis TaxID=121494 RepID=UPI003313F82C